jgi:hypothetical protein
MSTQPSAESKQNTTQTFSSLLPPTFLEEPLPSPPVITPVHFAKTSLPGYAPYYALVIDGCLTETECNLLLSAAEATTSGKWEGAMINVGGGKQTMSKEIRDCGRIIWDEEEVVRRIWGRVGPLVEKAIIDEGESVKGIEKCRLIDTGIGVLQGRPARCVLGSNRARRNEKWVCTGLNERMRFLRYEGGQYFRRKYSVYPALHHIDPTLIPGSGFIYAKPLMLTSSTLSPHGRYLCPTRSPPFIHQTAHPILLHAAPVPKRPFFLQPAKGRSYHILGL